MWTNTEDEILKAGIMKYGTFQWYRISSMLPRRSARHCKARWYEYLAPSIIKQQIQWTQKEDEKLLHLAKLMPAQWRTIAPIVGGRTPSQCAERYEKLLGDKRNLCLERYEKLLGDNYEPRNLWIDPIPEWMPARPDPVDMDQDEKEMLSVARARLANTMGKKAKRKTREKQLQEARRLASYQKRRELLAAGINLLRENTEKRKIGGIDYNTEIPFQKTPSPGFYDIAGQDQLVKFPTAIEELEGERRVDKEARLRNQDIATTKIAERRDAPSANKLNAVRKRHRLNLPASKIPDHELKRIAKMRILLVNEHLTKGNAATRALL